MDSSNTPKEDTVIRTPSPTLPNQIAFADDLIGHSPTRLTDVLSTAGRVTTEYLIESHHPCTTTSAQELRDQVDVVDLDVPLGSLRSSVTELRRLWLNHATWYHHPHYIAHLNCPISATAVAGETIASAVNTAIESWDQSSSAALIEQKILRWTASQLHWQDREVPGVFTSGGTQSNLQALLIARNKALSTHSYDALSRLCILHTADTHYSVARTAQTLGLHPSTGTHTVDTDREHRMSPQALQSSIKSCKQAGLIPIAVVATAGTTDVGAIDPILDIATVTQQHGIHLHVDAAYGGVLLISPTQRQLLDGIDQADTITIDFHKTYFQPVACSAVLVRNPHDFDHVSWHADYLNPESSSELNLADYSLQTTRRFDALKLWLVLRTHGAGAIGEAFDSCCSIARQAAELITANPEFILCAQPQLSTVVFRPSSRMALAPEQVKKLLHSEGLAVIATTVIDGHNCFKFTILDPTLAINEIKWLLEQIAHKATSQPTPSPTTTDQEDTHA